MEFKAMYLTGVKTHSFYSVYSFIQAFLSLLFLYWQFTNLSGRNHTIMIRLLKVQILKKKIINGSISIAMKNSLKLIVRSTLKILRILVKQTKSKGLSRNMYPE